MTPTATMTRTELGRDIRSLVEARGYTCTDSKINAETDEVRLIFIGTPGTLHIIMQTGPPSIIAEYCNEAAEVHATSIGLVHSLTRLRPLKYREIAVNGDLSPENIADLQKEHHYYLGSFWGLRVLVALGYLLASGNWRILPQLFGW